MKPGMARRAPGGATSAIVVLLLALPIIFMVLDALSGGRRGAPNGAHSLLFLGTRPLQIGLIVLLIAIGYRSWAERNGS